MALVFRYFALIAAAVSVTNWVSAERRLTARASADGAGSTDLSRRVVRVFYGETVGFFLLLGVLQCLGGYSDPLFPFYERTLH